MNADLEHLIILQAQDLELRRLRAELAEAPLRVTAAQLYIDGKLVINNTNAATSYIDTTQTLTPGSHNLVFKLWDAAGNVYTAQETHTVN